MIREYPCRVVSWLDGDTCDVDVHLEFLDSKIELRQRIRIDGINAPEVHSADPAEKAKGVKSWLHAQQLASVGSVVKIRSGLSGKDREKYGRWLAVITLPDGRDFAAQMIQDGHAVEYHGEKR